MQRLVHFNHKCATNYRLLNDLILIFVESLHSGEKIIKRLKVQVYLKINYYHDPSKSHRKSLKVEQSSVKFSKGGSNYDISKSNDFNSRCRRFSENPSPL